MQMVSSGGCPADRAIHPLILFAHCARRSQRNMNHNPQHAVEIGMSLGRYPDFSPLLPSHSYHVPPIPSFLLYATNTGLHQLISVYTGLDR